jgi:hypothetical protein
MRNLAIAVLAQKLRVHKDHRDNCDAPKDID